MTQQQAVNALNAGAVSHHHNAQAIFDQLCAPFAPDEIMWRIGPTNEKFRQPDEKLRAQALAYVDARAVMDRLDAVVGCENWQCNYSTGSSNSMLICNLGICIDGEWIWKSDGAGPSDMEADKGALSDAFKRAAVRWGIARYLYDLRSPKVEIEQTAGSKTKYFSRDTKSFLARWHDDFARKLVRAEDDHSDH